MAKTVEGELERMRKEKHKTHEFELQGNIIRSFWFQFREKHLDKSR